MMRENKHYSTEMAMHIKANAKERFEDKEAEKGREVATVWLYPSVWHLLKQQAN